MMKITHILKPLVIVTLLSYTANADANSKGILIASEDVKIEKLSKNEIERIFLGKTTIWEDGTRIQVGLSNSDDLATESFLKEFIGKNKRRFKKYWLKLVFAGYGIAPKFFKDDEKAIKYTKQQDGVITFISSKKLDNTDGLKIISID